MPNINSVLASQLARELILFGVLEDGAEWVVGSSYSAITFSYEVAKNLGLYHGYTQKDPKDPKKQVWKKFKIPEGSTVLQVEELVTTSNTFRSVRKAVRKGNKNNVNFLPVIGTLVHRPPEKRSHYIFDDEGEKVEAIVISLVEKEIWAVDPSDCPLCKVGSERYKPKENWSKLTKK
jgi:orotate phosphoribosyltransferase